MEALFSEELIDKLLQYPILLLVIVVIWFGYKGQVIMGKIIEKMIDGKKPK